MSLARQTDVETALQRPLTENESRYVGELLAVAERRLLASVPDLLTRAESDETFAALVADIEAEMLARVYRAPEGGVLRQEMEGNYSYSLNMQVASGLLDVLDREWFALGVGGWGSLSPETDAYARSHGLYRVPPHLHFQYGWGGGDQMSEVIW